MVKAKDLARLAMCVAMLIGSQLALSALSGVEIVSALLLCFAFSYGWRDGVMIAIVFSVLRCLIFGFQINVILLYLIYYPVFALFFGWLGTRLKGEITAKKLAVIVGFATAFTVCFTLLDDILAPLLFGLSLSAAKTYFLTSLYTLIPHAICVAVTVSIFFLPLTRVIKRIDKSINQRLG